MTKFKEFQDRKKKLELDKEAVKKQHAKGKLTAFLPHLCYEHYMNNNSNKDRDVLVTWLIDESIECRNVNNGKKNI